MTTQTSQHTPGPWKVDDESAPSMAGVFIRVHGNPFGGNMGIPISADAMTPSRNVTEDEMRSNARLIAASPEMLEELRQMVEFLTDSHRGAALHFDTRAARALLAKINAE